MPPPGWTTSTLAESCVITGGGTPKTGVPEYWGDDIPWVTPADMSADRSKTLLGGARSLSHRGLAESAARIVAPGSVIVSSRAPIGYVAIAGVEMATNQGCKTATPRGEIDSSYLYWFLVNARSDLEARASGTTFKEISGKTFGETVVWWPDLNDQRRIVEMLEDNLSRLDAGRVLLEQGTKRTTGLMRQVVVEEVTGRATGAPMRTPALTAIDADDGDLLALADGWQWRRLGDVADVVGGVTKDAKKQSDPALPSVPYLRVANVQRGRLKLDVVAEIRVPRVKLEQLRLQVGDVLLNEGGDRDKLCRGWVWEGQVENCIHQNHVFRARVRDDVVNPYFLSWTTNVLGGPWAERNGKQSVNLASISLSMVRRMPVIVPPRQESDRVARVLDTWQRGVDGLRAEMINASRRQEALRRSLLAAAFSGRLTGHSSDLDRVEEVAERCLEQVASATSSTTVR